MPRYFFDVHDGEDLPDADGCILNDHEAARREAVRYAASLLNEVGERFWTGSDWLMNVKDESGLVLFTLHFVGIEAPSVRAAHA